MDVVTYKNSFNSGDLITMLPGIKLQYEKTGRKARIYQRLNLPANYGHNDFHPIQDEKGQSVCMNEATFKMMKPLIEAQEYVESYEIWNGEKVNVDFDLTRHHSLMPLPGGQIHAWATLVFPQLQCDLSKPWIKPYASASHAPYTKPPLPKILINRTARYRNPYITYHFLKPYEDKVSFIGLPSEYEEFKMENNLEIGLLELPDFREYAFHFLFCYFFIGSQSFFWHLADSMKIPRIVEVCSQYPNSFPTGDKGHSFITQNALEYQFHKLLKETE